MSLPSSQSGPHENNLSALAGGTEFLHHDLLESLRAMKLKRLEHGEEIADLSMLNPDMAPPRFLLDKLMEASAKPFNHRYAVSRGVRRLRDAFAEKYQARFGVALNAESQVCATLGTKDAVLQALRVLCAPKDRVLCVSPVYPAYRSLAALHGLELCTVKIGDSEESTTSALCSAIEKLRPKVVLLNFPHNPTGAVVGAKFWSNVRRCAESVRSVVINDFVYGELLHAEGAGVSALSGGGDYSGVVESYSLSKAYNVPGWRVGALVGDARIVEQVSRLKSHVDYGIFLPVQLAAASALEARENLTLASSAEYRARAQVLAAGLKRCGFSVTEPAAGGSLWAKFSTSFPRGDDKAPVAVLAAAETLLSRAGILAAPGVLYGEEWSSYLRFALVLPPERLRDACHRIAEVEGGIFHA